MYILDIIIRNFSRFVVENMKLMHYTLIPKSDNKFSLLEIFTENDLLK